MKRILWLTILMALFLTMMTVGTGAAQELPPDAPTDDEVNAIAKQLYCPVCENIPLDVCPTQACAQWRSLIGEKLSQGWSENQIKVYFVEQYGDRVLATPPARGINWLVYLIPPIAILVGVFILYRTFKSWKQPAQDIGSTSPASESQPDEPTDDYVARLEEELRRR